VTVKELIDALGKLDPELRVFVAGDLIGYTDPKIFETEEVILDWHGSPDAPHIALGIIQRHFKGQPLALPHEVVKGVLIA
jgi:hypothetical protein